LLRPGGHVRHHARVTTSAARLLTGVPARGTSADLFLGGGYFWWFGRQPKTVYASFLHNGLSSLLPRADGAQVDQLLPMRGGVVAHISDIASGITYGALGRVVFIPATRRPAKVIGRATIRCKPLFSARTTGRERRRTPGARRGQ
jgi:hypothetical protein